MACMCTWPSGVSQSLVPDKSIETIENIETAVLGKPKLFH
jgi:hypothetical protein